MGCGESKYKQKGPSVKGQIMSLYTEGLAYKIVQVDENSSTDINNNQVKGEHWFLYNDTKSCLLKAEYCFGPQSSVQPAGPNSKTDGTEPDGYNRIVCTVKPGKTEKFVVGIINGFRSNVLLEKIEEE